MVAGGRGPHGVGMESNTTAPAPDGRRAGATWVAATGAFLLLAAAAVFIAVRWDTLPEAAKLALVGALTGGFLAGGRAVRRSLPATGDVFFHLGAFLLPVDTAGFNLRLQLGWRALLLTEGVVSVFGVGGLAAATGSVVLGWAAAAGMVVLACGIAATTFVPAPLVLAVAAVAALVAKRSRLAAGWATVAGLAPLFGFATHEFGLGGVWVLASGTIAAVVLGSEAKRTNDMTLVALAGLSLATGALVSFVSAEPSGMAWMLAAPSLFVIVEVVSMLVKGDPFWARPGKAVGFATELVAALALPVAAVFVLIAPIVEEGLDLFSDEPGWQPNLRGGVAFGLLATGWVLAAWRRRNTFVTGWTAPFAASAIVAGVVVGTASTTISAIAVVGAAGLLVVAGGVMPTLLAAVAALWAPVVVGTEHPTAALPVGLAAAFILCVSAVRWKGVAATALALVASLVVLESVGFAKATVELPVALILAVFAVWGLAALLDLASVPAAWVMRSTAAAAVVIAIAGSPEHATPVAFAATLLFVVDALRRDEPTIALGAALTAQALVALAVHDAGVGLAAIGVVLCGGAVVSGGLGAVVGERWRPPFVTAAVAGVVAGLALASADPMRLAEAIVLTGGLVIAGGLLTGNTPVAHAGGVLAIAGLFAHFALDGVTASEPFVAPMSVQLAIAGWQLRRRSSVSSWIAFGPAVALLGGAAIAERLSGGAAWHGLVAGAVGAVAVAAGGWWRLAGPLFAGTAIVVTATVVESLSTLAGVPTWAWLALGGTALLATGVCLEQHATSPVEAGRRVVDTIADRFS
ncbi:MAG: hypothetical protein QOF60_3401 [Actinomycetota bacterium]|jgi:hypothetical protein|nr:hypothetical protein [Actinomycetota bacterium]